MSERGSPVCHHLSLLLRFSQQHPCSSLHCLHSPRGFCLVVCTCGVTCPRAVGALASALGLCFLFGSDHTYLQQLGPWLLLHLGLVRRFQKWDGHLW